MENQAKKESKARSRAYPRYDLEEVIKFIETVNRLGGTRVSSEAIAAEMKKGTNNSTFLGRVSSAKQFGLLVQEGGKLSLSSLSKEIVLPRGDAEKRSAIRRAFSTPQLYKELIDGFRGKMLPEIGAFGNRLAHDYSIEANARELAARNFVRSAEHAGVLQNGILVVGTDDDQPLAPTEIQGFTPQQAARPAMEAMTGSTDQFIFDFSGGIKLIIPKNEKTSEAIADGELKNARKELSTFATKFVVADKSETDSSESADVGERE